MAWVNTSASWPPSASNISNAADSVLNQVGSAMSQAVDRVAANVDNVSYSRHDLSDDAQALLGLRAALNDLTVMGNILTVTPSVFGLGNEGNLSGQAAIDAIAKKLTDHADRHLPVTQAHALVLLLSAPSPAQLLNELTPLCSLLALPSLLAYQRQLKKMLTLTDDKMQQMIPAIAPRWKQAQALNYQPLRSAASLMGQQLAQLESLSDDRTPPLAKLSALAAKRTAMLSELNTALTEIKQVAANIWRFDYAGNATQLAAALKAQPAPINNPVSVALVICSEQPLLFIRELLP
ncbi:hypothetical protein [Shewanella baltica]|uniref:hypothetical protein n=1 Tax=Shewanella baltica TaxID=62322 RepID=UPI0039B00679